MTPCTRCQTPTPAAALYWPERVCPACAYRVAVERAGRVGKAL